MRSLTLAVALLAPLVSAQRTWIVDSFNGPGTDFIDTPAAVQAASPGDLVLLRTGLYSGIATSKGLRIVATGPVTLYPTVNGKSLVVTNLPANQTFALHGCDALRRQPFYAELTNNSGRVVLSSVRSLETCGCGPLHQLQPSIAITDCAQVSLDGCIDYGGPAVQSVRSHVVLTRCQLGFPTPNDPMGTCLLVDGGDVEVVESLLDARAASDVNAVPQPAVTLRAGSLTLRGTQAAFVQGGYEVQPTLPAPAIVATGGTLVLDPDVRLNPNAGQNIALRITGAQLVQRELAATVVRSFTVGGAMQAELIAKPGAPSVLLLGLPLAPAVLAIGTLELDPALTITLAVGPAPVSGVVAVQVAVPAALPLGIAIALQGAADFGAGIELSSPAIALSR